MDPEELQHIRKRGVRYIDDIRLFLKSLDLEFGKGYISSIYVDEKAGCIEDRCTYLRELAKRVDDDRLATMRQEENNATHS